MKNINFANVDILTIDPDRNARGSVKMILHNNGFRILRYKDNLEDIDEYLKNKMPDLLICATDINGESLTSFFSSIRHHEIGSNPFLPIIATTWKPTPDLILKVIGAGADDILTMPLSTSHLLGRINTLIKSRKKFVVTSDYIGPERGKAMHSDKDAPKIEVPNILKARVTGDKDELAFIQNAIDDAIYEVNLHKLEVHNDEISMLVAKIAPNIKMGAALSKPLRKLMDQLLYVVQDTARRLGGTKYDHVSELCHSLINVATTILSAKEAPNDKDVKLLTPLSKAIQTGFSSSDTAETARKISKTVKEK